ncbi:multifunctional fatty acid oxidation complex subunit alpha [Burkholderia sp. A9]|uniref:fatty acid oxidation complex subunit alpha FadB n=1 Tax=Burkholderia sp. A9 TaxID=1365108 RepID=UPI0005746152|nr:fatty acid oxidation complex subunit alpha FadB [Burkholderia sp. A9]KHK60165.1 multifunctional fatty acid oxidation complex subunit alpha [Burkholderia sp. A9]
MFQGQSLRVSPLGDNGIFELCFDRQGESINKFDRRTIDELRQANQYLLNQASLRGVLVTSAKDVFIVGADITEFGAKFAQPAAAIAADVAGSNEAFIQFEDLPVPSVVAINGFALGGGLEFALTGAMRVMSSEAQIGVPEVNLGLFPGFGGTVRLVRIAGAAVACDWVASGKPAKPAAAFAAGVVDEIAVPDELRSRAIHLLERAIANEVAWQALQDRKRKPLSMEAGQVAAAFEQARAIAGERGAPHQPAALAAIDMMAGGAALDRAGALALEAQVFGEIARTQAASSMVQTFLSEQAVKKIARNYAKGAEKVSRALVLGAGIMGGGIAITNALRKIPVRMCDLQQRALDQGMAEAQKQVGRQVKTGRLSESASLEILSAVQPQLDLAGIGQADAVVEAIVENLDIKRKVLADLELALKEGAILASNTSSLRIDEIAAPLKRPDRFVGMHFFNPVPMMSLVEIVRGTRTSDQAVATAVAYATALGKTAIVVRDCPGFLVNRVLTAYMRGFLKLIADGADFEQVDTVMESFGWPMGPAYLEDVVGMDTGSHVNNVISAGYADRMPEFADDALRVMVRNGRFGQKNGLGFYHYEASAAGGKPRRTSSTDAHALLAQLQSEGRREFTREQIVDRMMLPMVLEAARTLHEGVVGTAAEVDLAMRLGLGFPAYAGGPLKYADWLGLAEVVRRCDELSALGPAYEPSQQLREMASANERFYSITQ